MNAWARRSQSPRRASSCPRTRPTFSSSATESRHLWSPTAPTAPAAGRRTLRSARGREEAARVGARLADEPIAAIYVSSLRRTAETAGPLAAALGLEPVVEPDLREVFLGELDGLNLQLRLEDGDEMVRRALREERWELLPGAERQEAFAARVRAGITRIAERHRGHTVVVFTHGGVIGQVLCEATGCRPHAFARSDNASVTHLVVTPRRWLVRGFNDAGHLCASLTR